MNINNPVFGAAQQQPVDEIFDRLRDTVSTNTEELLAGLHAGPQISTPPVAAKILFGLSQSKDGRELLEFLCNLTVRRTDGKFASTIEEAALLHARKQERDYIMLHIAKAIEDGKKIVEQEGTEQ
ncbi:MAG: hypothetical protein AAF478_03515 [Pseudomonadota bacterium]